MRTRLLPLAGASAAGLKVYARWDATIDNPDAPTGVPAEDLWGELAKD